MEWKWLANIKEVVKDYSLGEIEGIKKNDKIYCCWNNLMRRTYLSDKYKNWERYKGCTVAQEWHTYSNFRNWYLENYYKVPGHKMELDKDILVKGNKCYSPSTCIFVPHEINSLFTSNSKFRGSFPIGVNKHKDKFMAQINGKGCIGVFNTPEEAFQAYKVAKEKRIKEVADKYREWIPDRVYQAMINWKVKIDD
ncbi:hypothetical protein [Sporolactobacillus putidus]|uniref:AP2 domain-containing protein n=1 Tax=Sporolactobacillus putidus TaxID=492735 RepID=A0A917S5C1_9BACL|nr:hypothetical protein [Sporolactobacillus putidus]GGL55797.1 hypothetical protein GCM10007968_19860 [Sporolactobacillus putidus]